MYSIGSISEPRAVHKCNGEEFYLKKVKKYGKSYFRYNGIHPTLVTSDPEMIKSILIKNFDSFSEIIELDVSSVRSCEAIEFCYFLFSCQTRK